MATVMKTVLFIAVAAMVVSGCATAQSGRPPFSCPFEQDAIQLSLKADPLLNYFDNQAHALDLCFYQLSNPNFFKLKSKYEDGLHELLECRPFDPTVTSVERVTVEPGKDQSLIVDRTEGSNYFGVVAGYHETRVDRNARFRVIPVITKAKIITPWKKYEVCLDINLEIVLGPRQLEHIKDLEN